ncbi:MAG: UDP-N-acetylmuramate--L-alanine ligase [Actinomycetaceae bacterium]|nr:UDP-N-acetylmuramate--L-alanine ligase [Actinomycetaceae bacterium]
MTAFHFIGIGGAGMSVVADLLAARGQSISGSDNRASDTTRRLQEAGIDVAIGHDAANVPADAVVVVSSAIRETNPELALARGRGQTILHRSQALALAAAGMDFVAVAGAHGKTTTSAMIATALRQAGEDPSWAIGGTVMGVGGGAHLGQGRVFVAEADESDASFLNYEPRLALVTNVEPDHLDHYGSREAFEDAFVQFAHRIVPGGLLVACADSEGSRSLARQAASEGIRVVTYGFGEAVDGAQRHVRVTLDRAGAHGIDGSFDDGLGPVAVRLAVVGQHNLLNAAGAWAAGVELGVDRAAMADALASFAGTGRRFELRGSARGVRVVDDYAHHPTEIEATLRAARAVAGDGRLRVLFQPHLYSRTHNFAAEFAKALSLADDVVVTAVYAAREDPIEGVESDIITQRMDGRARFVRERMDAARDIASRAQGGDLVLTVGAGDVTELGPVILEELEAQ